MFTHNVDSNWLNEHMTEQRIISAMLGRHHALKLCWHSVLKSCSCQPLEWCKLQSEMLKTGSSTQGPSNMETIIKVTMYRQDCRLIAHQLVGDRKSEEVRVRMVLPHGSEHHHKKNVIPHSTAWEMKICLWKGKPLLQLLSDFLWLDNRRINHGIIAFQLHLVQPF